MRWEKEQDLDRYTQGAVIRLLPHEQKWRWMRQLSGRPSTLPLPNFGLGTIIWMCYGRLVQQENERRDRLELYDLVVRSRLHNKLIAAVSQTQDQMQHGQLDNDELDTLFTLLHQVQKTTNPLAVRPQTERADQLTEDMEKISEFLEHGAPIRVAATA